MKININKGEDFEGTTLVTDKTLWKKDCVYTSAWDCGGKIKVVLKYQVIAQWKRKMMQRKL